ncbi:MAG: DUF177 domain-containing protein [Armatimonadetes bacterium]|jgi:uncharacterized protein|nr:DUF177 domain-containing protein [Armatimonadota bacterium]
MRLDLGEIAAHLGKRIKYSLNEGPIVDDESGLKCVEPVTGEVAFSNTGQTIDVRGKFQTVVELECGRCLKAYRMPVESDVEEALPLEGQPWAPTVSESVDDETPDEEAEPLFVDNVFDLDEYLRQSILVNVPIKPLCDEVCKGLCPQCGKNLNDGSCDCTVEPDESPFGALRSLFKDELES